MAELMDRAAFEQVVDEAIAAIPEQFQKAIENLAIVVEDVADRWTLELAGVSQPYGLLGFYHGIPLTGRTHDYGLVAPDQISIYRRPILAQCRTVEEAKALIHRVVRHEVAHYFGIDDDRLAEIGAY